ncbi:sigma-70 region 4 domain-containing protein [Patescibacteria group bacterium]|nr:sigma-70 region 4 domain-containing protein [Patescibacteria group bacterium]
MKTGQCTINTPLKRKILYLHETEGLTFLEISKQLGLALGTIKTHYYLARGQTGAKIPESPYPRYDSPPVIEGDALILPDAEIPFHHAEFINRVLDLADAWKIKQMIAAGDLLHFDSLSGWEPNWAVKPNGGLSEKSEKELMDFAITLPKNQQGRLMEKIVDMGGQTEEGSGFSGEMHHARKTLKALDELFDSFTWILGNHEGRLLRAINSPVQPSELLNLMKLEEGRWIILPYYYCLLNSGGETFRITHPKTAANGAARGLASQYFQHIIMGHSHKMFFDWDASGKYYAIQMGHCVDEERLAYVAQRDCKRDSHKLGAVIVRNGYPYLLTEQLDWERMKKL